MNQIKVAINKYEESKSIINSLKTSPEDQELLVPITTSLFVPGNFLFLFINPAKLQILKLIFQKFFIK